MSLLSHRLTVLESLPASALSWLWFSVGLVTEAGAELSCVTETGLVLDVVELLIAVVTDGAVELVWVEKHHVLLMGGGFFEGLIIISLSCLLVTDFFDFLIGLFFFFC